MIRRLPAPLPWLAGLLAFYLIAPLFAGVQQTLSADWQGIDRAALVGASLVSLGSATIATLVIALGGIPLGYVLARLPGRTAAALGFLVQLPLALPPLASGILLLFLFGYATPFGQLTGGMLTDSFAGVVLAEIFVAAPFLIISARSAFAALDPVLEGVAATLGKTPLEIFLRVSLPLAWPAILSGLLLAWLRAFGEFGATVMVAYHPYSLPVYTYVAFGSQGLPAMLPVLLPTLFFALAALGLSDLAAARKARHGRRRGVGRLGGERASAQPRPEAARPSTADRPLDLEFSFAKRLDGFDLDIAWSPGTRRLAILGPSGSGKSLTLRLIAGLEQGERARLRLAGRDLAALAPPLRQIAYVPQNYGLFPHLTLARQLSFARDADPGAAARWVERLGLHGLEGRYPNELSLGQQQRVALARALSRRSHLLLLDEPFSALDAPLRARLRRDMLALQQEFGLATILVTHDSVEAALLADEILVLEAGRVLQSGPTEALFARPASEQVARLLGADNVAEGIAADTHHIALPSGVLIEVAGPALVPGRRVGWSFAPARARIHADGRYRGMAERTIVRGLERRLWIRLGEARLRIAADHAVMEGESCRFDIDPHAIQVWPLGRVP